MSVRDSAVIPIPSMVEPCWESLSRLPIVPDEEPLVPVSLAPAPLSVFPIYARLGIPGAVPECFVREGVYRRLLAVARGLPPGVGLVVLDGWRPWRVQQYLFDTLFEMMRTRYPASDETALMARTREFVAMPSRDPLAPSPHLTGGAVDVTLCDADGLMLEMGSQFDEASPASHSDHLERLAALDAQQHEALTRRRVLYHAMCGAGFSNLPSEWWHYDLGNQLWAHYGGHPQAHYGPAALDTLEARWKRQLGGG